MKVDWIWTWSTHDQVKLTKQLQISPFAPVLSSRVETLKWLMQGNIATQPQGSGCHRGATSVWDCGSLVTCISQIWGVTHIEICNCDKTRNSGFCHPCPFFDSLISLRTSIPFCCSSWCMLIGDRCHGSDSYSTQLWRVQPKAKMPHPLPKLAKVTRCSAVVPTRNHMRMWWAAAFADYAFQRF